MNIFVFVQGKDFLCKLFLLIHTEVLYIGHYFHILWLGYLSIIGVTSSEQNRHFVDFDLVPKQKGKGQIPLRRDICILT